MKYFKLVFLIFVFVGLFGISCKKSTEPGCEKDTGTLCLTNGSLNTVQRIMINGVNYGSLDPGGHKDIELTPGTYNVQQKGISGGGGCSAFSVNIVACVLQAYSCNN
jgi:hypothetical protein